MKTYELTYSSNPPKEVEITETKVFIAKNIQQVERQFEGTVEQCYQYTLIEYNKDEYLTLLLQKQEDIDSLREELQAAKILLGVE